jgi:hypothetical protein
MAMQKKKKKRSAIGNFGIETKRTLETSLSIK